MRKNYKRRIGYTFLSLGIIFAAMISFPFFTDEDYTFTKDLFSPRETSVSMIFGGDLMLDRGVRSSVNKNFEGNYSALFKNLDLLKNYDIVFGNFEGVASDTGRNVGSIYSFRMDPKVIPALRDAGFNILSVANNHSGDWTLAAYLDTLNRLEEVGVLYAGGGVNKAIATKPKIIEKNGIKIGFLAFSDVGPNWMKAGENTGGILLASDPNFTEIINTASKEVDHLIVSFHWGEEYEPKHNARQEHLAHKAIDSGAKIIIGHHPHVEQDTEYYKDGFIAYSLGNFIFDQGFSKETMQGLLLEIILEKKGQMTINKKTVYLNKQFQPEKVSTSL